MIELGEVKPYVPQRKTWSDYFWDELGTLVLSGVISAMVCGSVVVSIMVATGKV